MIDVMRIIRRRDEDEEDERNADDDEDWYDYGTRLCMIVLPKLFQRPPGLR